MGDYELLSKIKSPADVKRHWQSQQSGNQGSHGRRIEEDAGL